MPEKQKTSWLPTAFLIAGMILGAIFALAIVFRISGFLGGPGYDLYSIPSSSMSPTLRVGDHMFALANAYDSNLLARGEIVVYKSLQDPRIDWVRRVIGLPGDRVQYREGRLDLNGEMVERVRLTVAEVEALKFSDERGVPPFYWERLPGGTRYVIAEMSDDEMLDNTDEFIVPPGHVFLLGDNRDNSLDSRMDGFVPLALIHGKPLYIYWSRDRSRIGERIQ